VSERRVFGLDSAGNAPRLRVKAGPSYVMGDDGWTRPREHTPQEEAIYGAAVFFRLHWRTAREHRKGDLLIGLVPGMLLGRYVDLLPEAKRVYLALCARNGVTPEWERP
jgi:hypothetical protein